MVPKTQTKTQLIGAMRQSGMKYREIAEELNIPITRVSTFLWRFRHPEKQKEQQRAWWSELSSEKKLEHSARWREKWASMSSEEKLQYYEKKKSKLTPKKRKEIWYRRKCKMCGVKL